MGKDLKGKELGKGISQRKDGRYEARANINGVKIDIYDFSLTNIKKRLKEEKEKILYVNLSKSNITLNEWYKKWFENYKSKQLKSEVSKAVYDRRIRNTYLKKIGDKQINLISQSDIQMATNELNEINNFSQRTIKEALGMLRECLESAIINNIISSNPCKQILTKDDNICQKERRVLSQNEQKIFLEEAKNSYYYEAYKFLLLTGVRIGEFSGLQWEDIDWDKKYININKTLSTGYVEGNKIEKLTCPKTQNSYRKIPFFGETESVLKSWMKKQDYYKSKLESRWRTPPELGNLVFTSTLGSPVTRYVIVHDLKRIENNINLKEQTTAYMEGRKPEIFAHIHPHAFRHTFATRCFEKGMSPLVVQSIMGHSDYNMTISYTHVLDNKLKEETEMIGNFL